MTKETLENWYVPRTEAESAEIKARLDELVPMTAEDITEIKLDHLRGDADDADRDEYFDDNEY